MNLNYRNLKPVGYPSHMKIVDFIPTAYNSNSTADTVRFNITTDGYWDPYSTYIKLEVDCT